MIQQEGPGWRLARDPSRKPFQVLLGGDGWAIEFTEQEWTSLAQLVIDLIDQLHKIENQLMPGENISLEIERHPWWGCLDGDRSSWNLRFVLEGDSDSRRGVEFSWPQTSAQSFVASMRYVWDSCSH